MIRNALPDTRRAYTRAVPLLNPLLRLSVEIFRSLRAVWRILRVIAHALHGLYLLRWHFPTLDRSHRNAYKQRWAKQLLSILGVQLEVQGPPPPASALIVCNHISWLDIFVINAACETHFVCKDDVRSWPVIGTLVALADTVFIARNSRSDAVRTAQALVTRLQRNERVAVFPEGTTTNGLTMLPFRPALFQSAIDAACAVTPMALRYTNMRGTPHMAPAYDGDISFGRCLWAIARAGDLHARLISLDLIASSPSRREMSDLAAQQIACANGLSQRRLA